MLRPIVCACTLAWLTAAACGQHWTFTGTIRSVGNPPRYQTCLPKGTPRAGDPFIGEFFALRKPVVSRSNDPPTIGIRWRFGDIVYDTGWRAGVGITAEGGYTVRFGRLDEGIRLTYSDELPDLTTLDEHPPSRAIGVVGGTYSGCGLLLNVDLQITVHLAGDVTGDDLFNSADLLSVFQAGQYEDDLIENSTWYTGDWDGDGEFTSSDLVVGFVTGEYQRMATVAVPEPAGWTLLLLAGLTALGACHRDRYPDILRK